MHGLILFRKTQEKKKRNAGLVRGAGNGVALWKWCVYLCMREVGDTNIKRARGRLKGGRIQRELPSDALLSPRV